MSSRSLFEPDLPAGLRYREDFLSLDDEQGLLEGIGTVAFSDFEMRGVVARRRVAFFGHTYDRTITTAGPIPAFLLPLRDRMADWAGVNADAFSMALVNEYPAGAPIGWHRDAPQYGIVAGLSLLSDCRMKFRPYHSPTAPPVPRRATHAVVLARRSAYLMTGAARQGYEHHIPPVERLRYSVTFRTFR